MSESTEPLLASPTSSPQWPLWTPRISQGTAYKVIGALVICTVFLHATWTVKEANVLPWRETYVDIDLPEDLEQRVFERFDSLVSTGHVLYEPTEALVYQDVSGSDFRFLFRTAPHILESLPVAPPSAIFPEDTDEEQRYDTSFLNPEDNYVVNSISDTHRLIISRTSLYRPSLVLATVGNSTTRRVLKQPRPAPEKKPVSIPSGPTAEIYAEDNPEESADSTEQGKAEGKEEVSTPPAERPTEQTKEAPADKPDEKATEQPAEEKSEEKPAENPTENAEEKSADKAADRPTQESTESADKTTEESADKPAEEPADKPVDPQEQKPAETNHEEKPAEKASEKPEEKPEDTAAPITEEKPSEKPSEDNLSPPAPPPPANPAEPAPAPPPPPAAAPPPSQPPPPPPPPPPQRRQDGHHAKRWTIRTRDESPEPKEAAESPELEKPASPEEPAKAEQPASPEEPVKSEEPAKPEELATTETPVKSEDPIVSEEPSKAEQAVPEPATTSKNSTQEHVPSNDDDLTPADLIAAWAVIKSFRSLKMVVSYDCGSNAGAFTSSDPEFEDLETGIKYMELFPAPDPATGHRLWPALAPVAPDPLASPEEKPITWKIPTVPFAHVVLRYPPTSPVDVVIRTYNRLLKITHRMQEQAEMETRDYNVVMTNDWMALIPRQRSRPLSTRGVMAEAQDNGPWRAGAQEMLGLVNVRDDLERERWADLGYSAYLKWLGIPGEYHRA